VNSLPCGVATHSSKLTGEDLLMLVIRQDLITVQHIAFDTINDILTEVCRTRN